MSTHRSYCCVCGNHVTCTMKEVLLEVQGLCNPTWPPIAFCSASCFKWLQEEMNKAIEHIKKLAQPSESFGDGEEARELLMEIVS